MKHLILGAGATLAESLALGIGREACLPLMNDFAKKTWENYTPHPLLQRYLRELGYADFGPDSRELFYKLEEDGKTNIEYFMEYCWNNRHVAVSEVEGRGVEKIPPGFIWGLVPGEAGSTLLPPPSGEEFWHNFLLWGVGGPIQTRMLQCFWENGIGWKSLVLSKNVAAKLQPQDLVLSLNYDTVFELALQQLEKPFNYAPLLPTTNELWICKPHGSLNLICNEQGFAFGQPDWLGLPQPTGYWSYSGLVPPRMNKRFSQHRFSQITIQSVAHRRPIEMIFWGVGLTESDVDLLDLYKSWSCSAQSIVVVNPDCGVAEKAEKIFDRSIDHFASVSDWLSGR